MRCIRADHPQPENCGDFISVSCLKAHGDFLLILYQFGRNLVFNVVKAWRTGGFNFFGANALSIYLNFESGPPPPLAAVIGRDQSHGMFVIDGQLE